MEAGTFKGPAITASGLIHTDQVRYQFMNNIQAFSEAQFECINGGGKTEDKNLALHYLRMEQEYPEKQIIWLLSKQAQPAASVEINFIKGMISYIVKKHWANWWNSSGCIRSNSSFCRFTNDGRYCCGKFAYLTWC
ncbi:hypothetical protein SedNR2807_37280 [Citrobacter sedlakii]